VKYCLVVAETESYVADELLTSRAGVRVRVGNTDAEGRMVMADVLCQMKEKVTKFLYKHVIVAVFVTIKLTVHKFCIIYVYIHVLSLLTTSSNKFQHSVFLYVIVITQCSCGG